MAQPEVATIVASAKPSPAAGRPAPPVVAALPPKVVGWCRRHPLLTDAAQVASLAVLTGADIAHRGHWIDFAWQLALWLPVTFRRIAPITVFMTVGIVAAGQWAFAVPLGGDLAVLVVLYTVAAYRSRILAAAAAAVEVGVVLVVVRFGAELWPRFLLLLTILVVATLCLGLTQQARRAHLAALTDRAERLEREAEQQAELAAAAERARIAREMHDITAHSLSVMITLADGAQLTGQPEQARAAMAQVARTGRQALADTRRVLDVLRSESGTAEREPLPGIESLEALLATVRATGLHTTLAVSGNVFTVPETAQLAIYRIVQEALTNTLKHADGPRRASIRLSYQHPQITVQVTDDGRPAAARRPPARQASAHGLAGIGERAALFDGRLTAGEMPSGGWQVSVTLLLPDSPPPPAEDVHEQRPPIIGPATR